ncbi:insulinase family protein [bacterium]|nr:MAG: insulinase family protein [bacterium]
MNDYNNKNIDWSHPPASKDIPAFLAPITNRLNVNNNTELFHFFSDRSPLVSFKIIFHKGTAEEEIAGITKIMFELLSAGTENKSAVEFATELDYLGASLSFNESRDYAICKLECLKDVFTNAFELMTDALFNPKFDELEIEKTIRKFISAKEQEEAESNYLSGTAMMASLFRDHPYGIPEYGYADEIEDISRRSIKNNWESYVYGSKISIVATGNIKLETATKYANELVSLMAEDIDNEEIDEVIPREQNKLVLVNFNSSSQSVISIGKPTINIKDENYPALNLINVIFGGYFLSRLNHLIREQKGLSYGVHSSISSAKYTGLLGVSTSVNLEKTVEVVSDVLNEMSKISNEILEEDELQRAKNYYLGSFLRSAENHKQISKMLTTIALNNLDDNYHNYFYSKIKNLRSDDLFSSQIDLFKPEGLSIAIAGNVNKLVEQFSNSFDKYDILDKEGKILKRIENNN